MGFSDYKERHAALTGRLAPRRDLRAKAQHPDGETAEFVYTLVELANGIFSKDMLWKNKHLKKYASMTLGNIQYREGITALHWYTKLGVTAEQAEIIIPEFLCLAAKPEKPITLTKRQKGRAKQLLKEIPRVNILASKHTIPLNYIRQIRGERDIIDAAIKGKTGPEIRAIRYQLSTSGLFLDGTPLPPPSTLMYNHPYLQKKIIDLSQARKVIPDEFAALLD